MSQVWDSDPVFENLFETVEPLDKSKDSQPSIPKYIPASGLGDNQNEECDSINDINISAQTCTSATLTDAAKCEFIEDDDFRIDDDDDDFFVSSQPKSPNSDGTAKSKQTETVSDKKSTKEKQSKEIADWDDDSFLDSIDLNKL